MEALPQVWSKQYMGYLGEKRPKDVTEKSLLLRASKEVKLISPEFAQILDAREGSFIVMFPKVKFKVRVEEENDGHCGCEWDKHCCGPKPRLQTFKFDMGNVFLFAPADRYIYFTGLPTAADGKEWTHPHTGDSEERDPCWGDTGSPYGHCNGSFLQFLNFCRTYVSTANTYRGDWRCGIEDMECNMRRIR